jgi:tetratricopeptide (TPR) repeat protein
MTNLGAVLTLAGRPGEGVTQCQGAVVLCRKIDDRSGLARALLNLGGAYQALADTNRDPRYARKAVEALQESLTTSRQLRSAKAQADAANNLGVALCSLWMFEPGIKCLQEALAYFKSSGQDEQAARTRWHLESAQRAASRR